MKTVKSVLISGLVLLLSTAAAQAGADSAKDLKESLVTNTEIFYSGRWELQALAGAQFSPVSGSRETFNYAPGIIRLGYQFTTPGEDHPLRGNWEALLDLYGAGIFNGAGTFLVGPTALIRYNFVQPGWKFVPYAQIGAGILFNDAYEDKTQKLVGSILEFSPQASVGVRYFINDKWSIDGEATLHHISNANTASRNVGVNSVGGQVGFSYLFGH